MSTPDLCLWPLHCWQLKEFSEGKVWLRNAVQSRGKCKSAHKMDWLFFVSKNKEELFQFLSREIGKQSFDEDKQVLVTLKSKVLTINSPPMAPCSYEEADTSVYSHYWCPWGGKQCVPDTYCWYRHCCHLHWKILCHFGKVPRLSTVGKIWNRLNSTYDSHQFNLRGNRAICFSTRMSHTSIKPGLNVHTLYHLKHV